MDSSHLVEEEVLETSTFNFPKGFLDFLIEDYLMEVNSSNLDSNTLSCVPKIREHLVFLKSIMGKLVELRNQQENLYEDVWNLGAQTAYKLEFLIDQLVRGDVLDSFSMSLQSITEDIMTIEADSSKIMNHEGRQQITLSQLESLSFCGSHSVEWVFPENIKKLNLWWEGPWNKIASIAKLPYLEVLKLFWMSFPENTWHVEEGDFPKLKFLQLGLYSLVKWTAASDDLFPNLEKLVLEGCLNLEEVPECLQNAANLETIDVNLCSSRAVSLLRSVEEFQKEMGNSSLQFYERHTRR